MDGWRFLPDGERPPAVFGPGIRDPRRRLEFADVLGYERLDDEEPPPFKAENCPLDKCVEPGVCSACKQCQHLVPPCPHDRLVRNDGQDHIVCADCLEVVQTGEEARRG